MHERYRLSCRQLPNCSRGCWRYDLYSFLSRVMEVQWYLLSRCALHCSLSAFTVHSDQRDGERPGVSRTSHGNHLLTAIVQGVCEIAGAVSVGPFNFWQVYPRDGLSDPPASTKLGTLQVFPLLRESYPSAALSIRRATVIECYLLSTPWFLRPKLARTQEPISWSQSWTFFVFLTTSALLKARKRKITTYVYLVPFSFVNFLLRLS